MAAYTAVTSLSSAGVSPALSLDPTAKTTSVSLALTSGSSGDLVLQVNLWQPGSAGAASWVTLISSTPHITPSSAAGGNIDSGTFASVLVPIAGLRLSSSTWLAGQTATLQALQSIQS
jgi:hypothetical protein